MKLPLLAFLALAWAGCATPSHLVFHQSSSVGVDVAGNADTGQVHVALGYDRQTNTLIPKTTTITDSGEENEAMSVISTSEVHVKWLGVHDVNEQFATGQAAVNLATRPRAAAQVGTLSTTRPATPE